MNKYLEKISSTAFKLREAAKALGVTPTVGSQWKRAIRESKKYSTTKDFQEAWKHKVPNSFNVSGVSSVKDRRGETIPNDFEKYTPITDSLKSLQDKGLGKVTFLGGETAAIKTPKGNIQISLRTVNKDTHVLQGIGSSPLYSETDASRGKGIFKHLWPHFSKELRKRGISKLELLPQSPVWEKNYGLTKMPMNDKTNLEHFIRT